MILILYTVSFLFLAISFTKDRSKTRKALKCTYKKLYSLGPVFLIFIIVLSISMYLIPDRVILKYLVNTSKPGSFFFALLLGSIGFMPGFVVYPLGGILLKKGVSYTVISVFTTSLMMVGILTLPIEKKYLGLRIAIIRNIAGLFTALVTAVATGLFFGENFLGI